MEGLGCAIIVNERSISREESSSFLPMTSIARWYYTTASAAPSP